MSIAQSFDFPHGGFLPATKGFKPKTIIGRPCKIRTAEGAKNGIVKHAVACDSIDDNNDCVSVVIDCDNDKIAVCCYHHGRGGWCSNKKKGIIEIFSKEDGTHCHIWMG